MPHLLKIHSGNIALKTPTPPKSSVLCSPTETVISVMTAPRSVISFSLTFYLTNNVWPVARSPTKLQREVANDTCQIKYGPGKIKRDIVINVNRSSWKVPLILVKFWSNFNFLDRYSENPRIYIFVKIRLVRAEFLRADGRTGETSRQTDKHDKANSRFSELCERA